MAARIAEHITQKLIMESIIEEDDRELYCYGFFLLITHFFFFLVTATTGIIADVCLESIVFYAVFMILRTYAGGVHAKSEIACTTLTTLSLATAVYGIKLIDLLDVNLVLVPMLAAGTWAILLLSPLDTMEKPLESHERKHFRTVSCTLALIFAVISVISQLLSFFILSYPITCSICLEGMLLVIGKVRTIMDHDL